MSLTTCSKEHCWDASLDNGWCNRHTNERIAELEAENAKLEALGKRCEALEWTIDEYEKMFDKVKTILSEARD